jgi:hypothetical protein
VYLYVSSIAIITAHDKALPHNVKTGWPNWGKFETAYQGEPGIAIVLRYKDPTWVFK